MLSAAMRGVVQSMFSQSLDPSPQWRQPLGADAGSQVSARRLRASSSAALHHCMLELVPVLPLFDYCVQESTC